MGLAYISTSKFGYSFSLLSVDGIWKNFQLGKKSKRFHGNSPLFSDDVAEIFGVQSKDNFVLYCPRNQKMVEGPFYS